MVDHGAPCLRVSFRSSWAGKVQVSRCWESLLLYRRMRLPNALINFFSHLTSARGTVRSQISPLPPSLPVASCLSAKSRYGVRLKIHPRPLAPSVLVPARPVFVIPSYSSPGDTVLGVGVETTQLPEVALDRGRRLELFLADKGASNDVQERITSSFVKAFDSGLFRVSITFDVNTWVSCTFDLDGIKRHDSENNPTKI